MIQFTIYGDPKSKGRPRFRNTGRFIQTYTDKETASYENLVKISFALNDCKKIEGEVPIKAKIIFYMSIPKSFSKKKRVEIDKGKIRPLKKIDLDNGIKIIFDALNKIAYDDDKQIVEVITKKYYSEIPRVEVELSELGEDYEYSD